MTCEPRGSIPPEAVNSASSAVLPSVVRVSGVWNGGGVEIGAGLNPLLTFAKGKGLPVTPTSPHTLKTPAGTMLPGEVPCWDTASTAYSSRYGPPKGE